MKPYATRDDETAAGGTTSAVEECPVSQAQQNMWLADQLLSSTPIYNMVRVLDVKGRLDPDVLGEALTRLAARHEALRTSIVGRDGVARQLIAPPGPVRPRTMDLSGLPVEERNNAALQTAIKEADRPFDLARGNLFRCSVITKGEDEYLVVLAMHHIIADGWSLVVLARELGSLYGELVAGREPSLPPVALQMADVAEWELEQTRTDRFRHKLERTCADLADAPRDLGLAVDHARTNPPTYRAATVVQQVDPETTQRLRGVAEAENASVFMVVLAMLHVLFARHAVRDEMVVGVPVAGRQPEYEGSVGYFLNVVPMRNSVAGNPTCREMVQRARDVALDAFSRQEIPFGKVIEALNPERDMSRMALTQVLFQYLGSFAGRGGSGEDRPSFGDAVVTEVDVANRWTDFDFEIQLLDDDAGLRFLWIYAADVYDAESVESLSAQLVGLLHSALENPDRRVADLDILTAEERKRFVELDQALMGLTVLERSLHRAPLGVVGELAMELDGTTLDLGGPAATATRLVPDPMSRTLGGRVFATGLQARQRRDGVVEVLGRPGSLPAEESGVTRQPSGAPSEYVARVARIFEDLLGVEGLEPEDHFFRRGGYSILAMRATIALAEEFDIELPLRAIFDEPTVAGMAALLNSGDIADLEDE